MVLIFSLYVAIYIGSATRTQLGAVSEILLYGFHQCAQPYQH